LAGLEDANAIGRDQAVVTQTKLPFAVYYPRLRLRRSVFVGQPRSYDLFDQDRRRHRAYRMVLSTGVAGDYYGVQGTDWRNPPILDSPSEVRRIGGRKLELHYDGARLRLVAWRTPRAAYWVSNTLLQSLSERQMIGIATSLRRIGQ